MTQPPVDLLVISYRTQGNRISHVDDSVCDYKFQLEVNPSDLSTKQMFNLFEKLLLAMGYSERSIMDGACSLAFNDMRDLEQMDQLVRKYDLADVPTELKKFNEKKKNYEGTPVWGEVDGYENV